MVEDEGGSTDLVIPGRSKDRGPGAEGCSPDRGAAGLDQAGQLTTGPGVPEAGGAVSRGGAQQSPAR